MGSGTVYERCPKKAYRHLELMLPIHSLTLKSEPENKRGAQEKVHTE